MCAWGNVFLKRARENERNGKEIGNQGSNIWVWNLNKHFNHAIERLSRAHRTGWNAVRYYMEPGSLHEIQHKKSFARNPFLKFPNHVYHQPFKVLLPHYMCPHTHIEDMLGVFHCQAAMENKMIVVSFCVVRIEGTLRTSLLFAILIVP